MCIYLQRNDEKPHKHNTSFYLRWLGFRLIIAASVKLESASVILGGQWRKRVKMKWKIETIKGDRREILFLCRKERRTTR